MANLGETFEVSSLPQGNTGSFDPLPPGWYSATMSAAEIKNTKTGTGQYIALRYDITGPTHQGRVVFGNLNIRNASPKAEEIGRQQLGDICRAIGLARVGDTDQLIGNSLMIKLDIEKSEQYGDKNQVKGFKPIAGGAPPRAAMATAPAAAAAPVKAAPPWATKR
jgi:hypothetical protein